MAIVFSYTPLQRKCKKPRFDIVLHELVALYPNIRPALERKWFWDFDYDKIDWQTSYKTVIARIIERGGEKEWKEIIGFYGQERVINALKNEITFLTDHAINEAAQYFSISKEHMLSYTRKRSSSGHWI